MRERVLAVVGAICLVAVALVVRSALVDGGDGGDGGDGQTQTSSRPVVACTPELASLCGALADDGRIAADPPTLDLAGAASPDEGIDGWITWQPAPAIANIDAGSEVWPSTVALGAATISALADPRGVDGVGDACGADATWTCLAQAAGPSLSIGVGTTTSAEGLARIAPLGLGLVPDADPAALEVKDVEQILDSPPVAQGDAATMARTLTTRPGSVALVVGPAPLLAAEASTPEGERRGLVVVDATPTATMTVVIAARRSATAESLGDRCDDESVADALTSLGLAPCPNADDSADLAGFLWQIRDRVG